MLFPCFLTCKYCYKAKDPCLSMSKSETIMFAYLEVIFCRQYWLPLKARLKTFQKSAHLCSSMMKHLKKLAPLCHAYCSCYLSTHPPTHYSVIVRAQDGTSCFSLPSWEPILVSMAVLESILCLSHEKAQVDRVCFSWPPEGKYCRIVASTRQSTKQDTQLS